MSADFEKSYRNTIGLFATGVTIIVAAKDGDIRGMTASAVTSVSLEPTQLLFCPAKKARISSLCEIGIPFTVNILSVAQEGVSNHFAGAEIEPEHEFVEWPEAGDAPRIAGSLASVACEVRHMHDGGDHWIVVGEVKALHREDETSDPLLFYAGDYRKLAVD